MVHNQRSVRYQDFPGIEQLLGKEKNNFALKVKLKQKLESFAHLLKIWMKYYRGIWAANIGRELLGNYFAKSNFDWNLFS